MSAAGNGLSPRIRLSVNGRFYASRATGVQRVARELVARICNLADVTLDVPAGFVLPRGPNPCGRLRRGLLRGPAWEQLELPARRLTDHAVSLDPANAGPVLAGRRVLILHDVFPLIHPEWYTRTYRGWYARTVAAAARRSARVVMFSEWAKREAVSALGLAADRIVVVPQGVAPFDRALPPELVARTLERLRLADPFVLALGDGDARKNAGFLVDVFRRWRARDPQAPKLVLVGEPYAHVHARAAAPPTPGVVRVGHVPDEELAALYTAARAFCFPSHAEGFGRPPLEAMACGTPVVAAGYGAAHEVLGDAAVIAPQEPDAWIDAVSRLLQDGEERRRRIESGRAHATRFRWSVAAAGVLEACAAAAAEPEPLPLLETVPGGGG